jgi:hypothetical protein
MSMGGINEEAMGQAAQGNSSAPAQDFYFADAQPAQYQQSPAFITQPSASQMFMQSPPAQQFMQQPQQFMQQPQQFMQQPQQFMQQPQQFMQQPQQFMQQPQQFMQQMPMQRMSDPTQIAQQAIASQIPQARQPYQAPAGFTPNNVKVDFTDDYRAEILKSAQEMAGEGGDKYKALYDDFVGQGYNPSQIDQAMGMKSGSTLAYLREMNMQPAAKPFQAQAGYQPLLTPDNYMDFYLNTQTGFSPKYDLAVPDYRRQPDPVPTADQIALMNIINSGGGEAFGGDFGFGINSSPNIGYSGDFGLGGPSSNGDVGGIGADGMGGGAI